MISILAGIGVALGAAASVAAFIRSAARKNKRPTIGSILVALFVVPFVAATVSGLTAVPLELLGRVPGLSIFAWLVATAILVALCAIGGHVLASVMGEVPNDFAAEQLAASLVPSPGGNADATWAARSRTLLTAILRRGRLTGIDTAEIYRLFAIADRDELRTMLAGTAAEPFLAEGATRLFDSVRSSSRDAMSALEYAASATAGAPFSLTRWASDPADRRWVFLPYRADQIAALKSLIGPWMRLAIFATMSRPEGDDTPT